MSPEEAAWLTSRQAVTAVAIEAFLQQVSALLPGFDGPGYIRTLRADAAANASFRVPTVGIAISGGGYRAMLTGAGFLKAADARTTSGVARAGAGIQGLLQTATYVAGLSGGSWAVGSLFVNNFTTVEALQAGGGAANPDLWQLDRSVLVGPRRDGIDIANTAAYWQGIAADVDAKRKAGFDTSITDYWGRGLSFQLVNATDGGPVFTLSSVVRQGSAVALAAAPLPIFVADSRAPNTTIVPANSTLFELTPWELGSWDPSLFGFAPTRYLGSNFSAGAVVAGPSACVRGLDNVGFAMGTSSSIFNAVLTANLTAIAKGDPGSPLGSLPPAALSAIADALKALTSGSRADDDIARWAPNPFLGYTPPLSTNNSTQGGGTITNSAAAAAELSLVDGGEDLQNLPLAPLLLPLRSVDVVFAVDASSDTPNHWPNGTALRATKARADALAAGHPRLVGSTVARFPAIPDANTFVRLGLNARPAFFGCDDVDTAAAPAPPLLVYLPNAPYTAFSNASTFVDSLNASLRDALVANAVALATQASPLPADAGPDAPPARALDPEWPACVACAILQRSLARTAAVPVPQVCTDCFARYCWNGTVVPDAADGTAAVYDPALRIEDSAGKATRPAAAMAAIVAVAVAWLAL